MTNPALIATSITIGTPRPRILARFYADLLGWPITGEEQARPDEPDEAGWAQLKPPEGQRGMTLNFEWERYYQRPVWPAEPDRPVASQHLDIWVPGGELDDAASRAVDRGAELAGLQPQDDVRVLLDPDGHPFCLFS